MEMFTYLDSMLFDLEDNKEVEKRINNAAAQMGILHAFFGCKRVSRETKYVIFMAIPLNIVLWGCESWSVMEKSNNP
jgi:hypothetical protein